MDREDFGDTHFESTCTDKQIHIPAENRNVTTCRVCKQHVSETGDGSGYWFTEEDYINWDYDYNWTKEEREEEKRKAFAELEERHLD